MKIITPLLEGLIRGEVTRKTINQYKKVPLETSINTQNKESKENNFLCKKCGKKFLLNRTLKTHITRMHKDTQPDEVKKKTILNCKKCDLSFDEDTDLDTHMADHLSIETQNKQKQFENINQGKNIAKEFFSCDYCQKAFTKEALLQHHNKSQHVAKYNKNVINDKQKQGHLKCDECEITFTGDVTWENLKNLTNHKRSNHEKLTESDMKINCDECDFTSKGVHDLKRHHRDVHKLMTNSTSPPPKKHRESILEKTESVKIILKDVIELAMSTEVQSKTETTNHTVPPQKAKWTQAQPPAPPQAPSAQLPAPSHQPDVKEPKPPAQTNESLPPWLKEIDEDIRHLFEYDDVEHPTIGNGACGSNGAALHFYRDQTLGQYLKRNINNFQVDHWEEGGFKEAYNRYPIEVIIGTGKSLFIQNENEM